MLGAPALVPAPDLLVLPILSTNYVVWCGVVWCGVVWCGVVCCMSYDITLYDKLFMLFTLDSNFLV